MLRDLRPRLFDRVPGYAAVHPLAADAARQRPAAVAGIPRPRAAATRLAALAGDLDQRAGAEIPDGSQLAAQFIPDAPQSFDVAGLGHVDLLSVLYHL